MSEFKKKLLQAPTVEMYDRYYSIHVNISVKQFFCVVFTMVLCIDVEIVLWINTILHVMSIMFSVFKGF